MNESRSKPLLVLASTSPYRKRQMDRLGLEFETHAPLCDEDALKADVCDPWSLAVQLAQAKARSLSDTYDHGLLVGGDQVVEMGGRILGKAGSLEGACEQLRALSGRTHRLHSSVCVLKIEGGRPGLESVGGVSAQLTMRELADEEIERYARADEPFDCAGSYKLESLGVALFDKVECEDPSAIEGLPLMALCAFLRVHGWNVP